MSDHVETSSSLWMMPVKSRSFPSLTTGEQPRAKAWVRGGKQKLRLRAEPETHILPTLINVQQTGRLEQKKLLREFAHFEPVTESVFAVDPQGRIIFWNRRAAWQYCWTKKEALGQIAAQLLQTDFPVPFRSIWKTLLRDGRWQGRLTQVTRDGWNIQVTSSLLLRRDRQGNPIAVLQTDNDLIEAKRTAPNAANKKERFSALNIYSPVGNFLMDPQGRCTSMDRRCQTICGVTFQESQGKVWSRFVLSNERKPVMKEWAAITRKAGEYSKVFRLGKGGQARWMHVRSAPLLSDQGIVREHMATVEDLTERLNAQEARQASEAFNRRILASSPDCIKVLDPKGRLLFVNLAGQQLMEIDDPKKLLHTKWIDVWRSQERPLVKRALTMATSGGMGRFEGYRPTMTGVPKWWEVQVTGIFDADAKLINLLVISRDITDRKVAVDELAKAQIALQAHAAQLELKVQERTSKLRIANQMQKSLSARLLQAQEIERRRIARELHDEIGQQLTGLKLLLEHYVAAPEKPPAQALAEGQAIILNLLKQIQELALELRPQAVDRLGLRVGLQWHFKRYEVSTGVRVKFDFNRFVEDRVPAELKMTTFRLIQEALTNVARHAGVKAAAVRISSVKKNLRIQIGDQGRGFDRSIVQSKMTTGLSVMDERVALTGGTLDIKTAPGTGTQVLVELPLNAYANRCSC